MSSTAAPPEMRLANIAPSPQLTPAPLDCTRAATGVWLVKVPKYLAKKWTEAPDNTEVGVIRIHQSRAKAKQEVMFHLSETLANGSKPGEEKVPIEHKFMMNHPGNQALYILKQPDDASQDGLSIIGKVMQRAECTPVQNDRNYISLKRETNKQFIEPKRQIKIAEPYIRPLPKPAYSQFFSEKKDKSKRLRMDKEKVLDQLFNAFAQHQYYNIKDLVKKTQQPTNYLKGILNSICRYNGKGAHKNMWELKDEFKQSNVNSEQNKKAAVASLSKDTDGDKNNDELMDDDDDDSDDFDDVDDDGDLEDVDEDME